jgi:hypothetical protein
VRLSENEKSIHTKLFGISLNSRASERALGREKNHYLLEGSQSSIPAALNTSPPLNLPSTVTRANYPLDQSVTCRRGPQDNSTWSMFRYTQVRHLPVGSSRIFYNIPSRQFGLAINLTSMEPYAAESHRQACSLSTVTSRDRSSHCAW